MIKKIIIVLVFIFILNINDIFASQTFRCEYIYSGKTLRNQSFQFEGTNFHGDVYIESFRFGIVKDTKNGIARKYITGREKEDDRIYLHFSHNGENITTYYDIGPWSQLSLDSCHICEETYMINVSTMINQSYITTGSRHLFSFLGDWFMGDEEIRLDTSVSEYYDYTKSCPYPYNDYNLSPNFPTEDRECFSESINQILTFCGTYIFTPIRWIVPIALILITSFDLAKAVFVKVEDGMKKAKDNFMKRALIALIIFLAPTIVTLVLNIVESVVGDDQCINDVDLDSVNSQ